MSFDSFNQILRAIRARYPGLSKRMTEADAMTRWDSIVGPIIAKHARPLRVQNGILWVEVDHPIWKSELHHRKRQILDLLNGAGTGSDPIITEILWVEPRDPREPRRSSTF